MPPPTKKFVANVDRGANDRFRILLTTIVVVLACCMLVAFVTPLLNESSWLTQSWGPYLMESFAGESEAKTGQRSIYQPSEEP